MLRLIFSFKQHNIVLDMLKNVINHIYANFHVSKSSCRSPRENLPVPKLRKALHIFCIYVGHFFFFFFNHFRRKLWEYLTGDFFWFNHKSYNFLACDWFKNVLFSTNSLAKLLSDSLLLDSLLLDSLLSDSLVSQSHSKM